MGNSNVLHSYRCTEVIKNNNLNSIVPFCTFIFCWKLFNYKKSSSNWGCNTNTIRTTALAVLLRG